MLVKTLKIKKGYLVFFTIKILKSEIKGKSSTLEVLALSDNNSGKIKICRLFMEGVPRGGLFRLNTTVITFPILIIKSDYFRGQPVTCQKYYAFCQNTNRTHR